MELNFENIQKPAVSIILPTYNRGDLIKYTLDCITSQSFEDWECIIIDDGSIDNTVDIIRPYLKKDRRIKFSKRTGDHEKGPSGCRNQGIELSTGEYIIFFDSDDIIHPDALKLCLESIRNFDFCNFSKKPYWGEWADSFERGENFNVRKININNLEDIVTQKLGFACCTVMWKKKALGKERFQEDLVYAEEWEYYSRLISNNLKGIAIDKILYYNRKHPKSNTGKFWKNDPVMLASKVKAIKLVIDNLKEKKLLSKRLSTHFLQLGFLFKQPEIINYTLKNSDSNLLNRLKYKIGFFFYPLLKPLLNLKSKIF